MADNDDLDSGDEYESDYSGDEYDSDYSHRDGDPIYEYCLIYCTFGKGTRMSQSPLNLRIKFNIKKKDSPSEYIKSKFQMLFDNNFSFKYRKNPDGQKNDILVFYDNYKIAIISRQEFDYDEDENVFEGSEGLEEDDYAEYSPHNLQLHKKEILDFLMNKRAAGFDSSDFKNVVNLRASKIKTMLRSKGLPDDLIEAFIRKHGKLNGGKSPRRKYSICWPGFHRVPGTKAYTKHSCKKNS